MFGSVVMGVSVWAVSQLLIPQTNLVFSRLLLGLTVSIFTGMIVYGAVGILLRCPEVKTIGRLLKGNPGVDE